MKKTGKTICMVIVAVMLMATMSITAFAQNGNGNGNGNGLRLRDGSCRNVVERVCVNEGICPNERVRVRGNHSRNINRIGGGIYNRTGINSRIAFAQNGNGLRLRDGSCRNVVERVCICVNEGICLNDCARVRGNRNRNFNRVSGGGICDGTGINNGGRRINCR